MEEETRVGRRDGRSVSAGNSCASSFVWSGCYVSICFPFVSSLLLFVCTLSIAIPLSASVRTCLSRRSPPVHQADERHCDTIKSKTKIETNTWTYTQTKQNEGGTTNRNKQSQAKSIKQQSKTKLDTTFEEFQLLL